MAAVIPLLQMTHQGMDLEVDRGLDSFFYFESVYGCATYRLSVYAYEWEPWDRAIRNSAKDPAKLRWGYALNDGELWTDWRTVLINGGNFRYEQNALYVELSSTCAGFKLAENFPEKKTVFKNMLVSDMVSQIAQRNGLTPQVRTTKGKLTFYQCTLPDARFIKEELLPHAVSSEGRCDYYFWIKRGTTLVFEPPDFSQQKYSFRLSGTAGDQNPTEINVLDTEYRRMFLARDNTLSTVVRGYDPMKKKPIKWTADDNTVNYPQLAGTKPSAPENPATVFPLFVPHPPDYDRTDVENHAKQIWGGQMHGLFRMTLRVFPLLDAEPGQVVNVDVRDSKGQPHFLGGRYFMWATALRIATKQFDQFLYLERRTHE